MHFRLFVAGLLSAAALMSAPFAAARDISVITFNIRDGFSPNDSHTGHYRSVAQNRADFVAFMKKRSPDIACFQELCSGKGVCFNEEKFRQIAREYGHDYTVMKAGPLGLGISSKHPIKLVYKGQPNGYSYRGILHAEILGLQIINTHLNATTFTYDRPNVHPRRTEAEILKNHIRDRKLKRVLLMGDLNCRSPYDHDVHRTHDLNPDYWQSPRLKNDYATMSMLLSTPLVDSIPFFIASKDRMTNPVHRHSARYNHIFPDKTGERIDYILVSPDLVPNLKTAYIWNRAYEPADKYKEENAIRDASDHAPNELWLEIPDGDLK